MTKLTEWLIFLAISFANSHRYRKTKTFFYNLLENEYTSYRVWVDLFLIGCVLISVGIYLYDIKYELDPNLDTFSLLFSIIFAIEYLLRFWLASDGAKDILSIIDKQTKMGVQPTIWQILNAPIRKKLIWMSNPLSIIDLISIFPQFRILRIFKLFRYSEGSRNLLSVFQDKRQEVFTLFVLIAVAIFTASALFYFFEQDNKHVNTFFDAMYWAVITITTVGYGDIAPITSEGRALAIFLVFSGIGVIAMLTSIVTTGLSQKLSEIKERKNMEAVELARKYILIVGFGKMSQDLCKILIEQKSNFVVIDKNEEVIKRAWKMNYNAVVADATEQDTLKYTLKADKKATAVVCLTNSDITNVSIALTVKAIGSYATIISKCTEPKFKAKMSLAGIDMVMDHSFGAIILASCLNKPYVYQAISNMIFLLNEVVSIDEIKITNTKKIDIHTLEADCIIIGVFKHNGEFFFNPDFDTFKIEKNDSIIVIGKPLRIEGIKLKFSKGNHTWHKF